MTRNYSSIALARLEGELNFMTAKCSTDRMKNDFIPCKLYLLQLFHAWVAHSLKRFDLSAGNFSPKAQRSQKWHQELQFKNFSLNSFEALNQN
jgi:hypothetical protein